MGRCTYAWRIYINMASMCMLSCMCLKRIISFPLSSLYEASPYQLSLWTLQSCRGLCAHKIFRPNGIQVYSTQLYEIVCEIFLSNSWGFTEQWSIGKCFYFNELLLWSIYAFALLRFRHTIRSQKLQIIIYLSYYTYLAVRRNGFLWYLISRPIFFIFIFVYHG